MFQKLPSRQSEEVNKCSLQRNAMQYNGIVNKRVSILFDRVTLVRMGRLGPQERRERRYDT